MTLAVTVLWALLGIVAGREVVLDTYPERYDCTRALRDDNMIERGLQVEGPACWEFTRRGGAVTTEGEGEE